MAYVIEQIEGLKCVFFYYNGDPSTCSPSLPTPCISLDCSVACEGILFNLFFALFSFDLCRYLCFSLLYILRFMFMKLYL